MIGQPLVSVVMPFLTGTYLDDAIASVVGQTYSNWELLLCDDGSSDGSRLVASRHAARDPDRVRLLEHPGRRNLGASAARNLGLAHARGDLIAFLDADDVWLPHKLTEQVALLAARPDVDVLTGSTEFWHSWTGRPADAARDRVQTIGVRHGSFWPAPTFLATRLRGRAASPGTCSLIVRRDAVIRAGEFEETFRTLYTDQVFYVKLFLHSTLLVVDTCWDRYRQHDASSCGSAAVAGTMHAAQQRYLAWVREYLTVRGVTDRGVWSALRLAEWRVRHPTAAALSRRVRHVYYDAARLVKRTLGVPDGRSR